ncbi:MAG: hypothetical protein AAGC60_26645 [Acidobacteriota bacterium]
MEFPTADAATAGGAGGASGVSPTRFPVWLPPDYDQGAERYPVIYVHHPQARHEGRWIETLDRVVGRTVALVIVVFLETPPGEALIDALIPIVDARFRTRAEAAGRANVGQGFHTQAPLWDTFRKPGLFGHLAIQSYFGIEQQIEEITALAGDLSAADMPLRAYVEWGQWDIHSAHEAADVRDSGRWLEAFLRQRGWQVHGGEVFDSTDFSSWIHRTSLLLETLFPIDGQIPHQKLHHWLATGKGGSEPETAGSTP